MAELDAASSAAFPTAAAALASIPSEDLLTGGRQLRQAFAGMPLHTAYRDDVIISAEDRTPAALLIHRGTAYASHVFPDGRRAIIDLFLPNDIVGVEHAVVERSNHDVIAACRMGYRLMPVRTLRELMAEPEIAAKALALTAEARWRADRHIAAVTRLDAHNRIAYLLLSVYDRLRRADLIGRSTFNLHLRLDQIGDHLGITPVHASRTLRKLREAKLAIVDHGVVMILDMEGLRAAAVGLPSALSGKETDRPRDSERALPNAIRVA